MSNVIDRVTSMVSPILADLSLELYDLDFAGGVLKVTIDTPPGSPAGVDIDQIALVTRLLGRELDHDENAVPGRFTLEVTSPGLERTLRTPAHFVREAGKEVNIRLREQHDGRRRIAGLLLSATDTTARVRDENGAEVEVPLALIDKAKTVFVWEANPKPNSPEARSARDRNKAKKNESDNDQTDNDQEVSAS
ncbi:MAG: ribosome maturation factor RimP [Actinomycetota bacterium]|jgi:ribosome maturation factor RimP